MDKEITIGLCDDNKAAVEQLQKLIKEYLDRKEIEATLLSFFRCQRAATLHRKTGYFIFRH